MPLSARSSASPATRRSRIPISTMKRRSPRLSTGRSRLRRSLSTLAIAVLLGALAGPVAAQSLRLRALSIPADVQAGRWVSYQVRLQTQNRPPRDFSQRLAVVAREGSGEESGVWIELKTGEAGKVRIERGFYVRPQGKEKAAGDTA